MSDSKPENMLTNWTVVRNCNLKDLHLEEKNLRKSFFFLIHLLCKGHQKTETRKRLNPTNKNSILKTVSVDQPHPPFLSPITELMCTPASLSY